MTTDGSHPPILERLFPNWKSQSRNWQPHNRQQARDGLVRIAHRGLFDRGATHPRATQSAATHSPAVVPDDSPEALPENSLSAFRAAIGSNLPFECDCRFSREGEPIVYHDATARRLTGLPRPLSRLSRRDIARLRLRDNPCEPVPALREVLALTDARVPIFLEVKAPWLRPADWPMARLASILMAYPGPIAVVSSHPGVLSALRKRKVNVPLGLITGNHLEDPAARRQLGPRDAGRLAGLRLTNTHPLDFIAADVRTLPGSERIAALRAEGTPVLTWTVRTPAHWSAAREWADAAIFEQATDTGDGRHPTGDRTLA